MRQTLRLLLAGDGEKQIAQKLRLSQHTIHVYVKALYRGFGVNSRGELMSHFVAAGGSIAALDDPPSLQRATG
jgi:DNA-binding NarL/FixJ family response regulator